MLNRKCVCGGGGGDGGGGSGGGCGIDGGSMLRGSHTHAYGRLLHAYAGSLG